MIIPERLENPNSVNIVIENVEEDQVPDVSSLPVSVLV